MEVRIEHVEPMCVAFVRHLGPCEGKGHAIGITSTFAEQQGLVAHGRHHEIYLSDPRRVAPERLKTILRIPVRKAGR